MRTSQAATLAALVAAITLLPPHKADAQCYSIQQTYVEQTVYLATFSPWGNNVWFEVDIGDSNYGAFWQTLVAAKLDDIPVQIAWSGVGINGTYHIIAIQMC